MTFGVSLLAIAVGAILKFAVTALVAGIRICTDGVILMVVGTIGLLVSQWMTLPAAPLLSSDHEGPRARQRVGDAIVSQGPDVVRSRSASAAAAR